MKKLTAQHRVIGGVFCLFFLGSITQAQDDGTIITTSEEPVVVIDSYEAALDENTKQSDLNIGEAVEPDFFNDIVDRIRGIFTSDDGSVEIGFLEGVFKSDTPALRIDQEGDAILQGDLTVRTVKSAGDLTVGSPEEVHNTEGKAITVGDKDRGVIELHGGDGQGVTAKGIVQTGEFGMEIGTLTNQVLKFFTNSTPRMSITTEGNVGIGETTTNPTARLEVGGDIKATDTITASSFIGDGSQLTGIEGKFTDGTSATDAVFITGNVGIGTTSPQANLHIKDETPLVLIDAGEGTASSGNAFLSLENDLGYRGNIAMGRSGLTNGGENALTFRNDYSLGSLLFQTSGSVNRMIINSDGNVGIGTTDPDKRLHVNGSGDNGIKVSADGKSTEIHLHVAGGDYGYLNLGGTTQLRGNGQASQFDGSVTATSFIGDGSQLTGLSAGGKFTDGNSTTDAVFTTGNVGIGTTDPGAKLEVNGEIRSRGNTGINYTGITASGDGTVNKAIMAQDYSQWIWNTATNWGVFWAGNSGAAYSKFGTTNPNEIVFVGGGNSRASIDLDNGNIKGSGLYGNLRNQVLYRKNKYNGTYIHGVDSSGNPATSGSNYRELPPGVSTGVYSWWNYADSVGEPSGSYGSAIGFGHGASGTTEIWGGWTNGKLYTRFLRDCCQGWSKWRKILVEDANGNVGTSGHLTVGEGGYNKTIKVRHINGKDHDSDDNSALYLNYNTGQSVVVGKNDKYSNLVVYGNTTSNSFLYSSDQNKKKNIQTLGSPLETIQNLRGVSFRWQENDEESIGFIAQEVEKVLPSLVSGEAGEKSVAYGNLTAVLVEAVKELSAQNKALQKRVKALENR